MDFYLGVNMEYTKLSFLGDPLVLCAVRDFLRTQAYVIGIYDVSEGEFYCVVRRHVADSIKTNVEKVFPSVKVTREDWDQPSQPT